MGNFQKKKETFHKGCEANSGTTFLRGLFFVHNFLGKENVKWMGNFQKKRETFHKGCEANSGTKFPR